jgi:hypothetical protein
MATSSAIEKLVTSVWFIGVDSEMGRKREVVRLKKRVGKAMPWASCDSDVFWPIL